MVQIREALQPLIDSGKTKYRVAKDLDIQPIMVDNYLKGKVKSPQFKVCKKIYDTYGVVTFPYTEEELQSKHEQLLMDFN